MGAVWIFIIFLFPPTMCSSRPSSANTNLELSASPGRAEEESIKQVLAENPPLPVMGMLWLSLK